MVQPPQQPVRQAEEQQVNARPQQQLVQLQDPNAPEIPVFPAVAAPAPAPTTRVLLTKRGCRVGRPPAYRGPGYMELKWGLKSEIDWVHGSIDAVQWKNRYAYYERTGIRYIPADWKTSDDADLWDKANGFVKRYNESYPGEEESFRRQFAEVARYTTNSNVEFMRA